MPYCTNCGTKLADDVSYCPHCGKRAEDPGCETSGNSDSSLSETRKTEDERMAPVSRPMRPRRIVGCLDIGLLVMSFLPWIAVDIQLWKDEFSLPELLRIMSNFQDAASSLFGTLYADSQVGQTILSILVGLLAIWVLMIAFLGWDAYCYLVKREGCRVKGAVLAATIPLVVWIGSLAIDSNLGSIGIGRLTIWPWRVCGLVLATAIYAGVVDPDSSKGADG